MSHSARPWECSTCLQGFEINKSSNIHYVLKDYNRTIVAVVHFPSILYTTLSNLMPRRLTRAFLPFDFWLGNASGQTLEWARKEREVSVLFASPPALPSLSSSRGDDSSMAIISVRWPLFCCPSSCKGVVNTIPSLCFFRFRSQSGPQMLHHPLWFLLTLECMFVSCREPDWYKV